MKLNPAFQKHISDDEFLAAVKAHGSQRKAARALGINQRTLERRLKRLRLRGYAPEHDLTHVVPEDFEVSRVSSLYDADGNLERQWVITSPTVEAQKAAMEAAFAALSEELPRAKPTKAPSGTIDDLLNNYVLTDYHIGMLAWPDETGEPWDTEIAEQMIVDWFAAAIAQSPKAKKAVFAQLGDFLHWDGMDAVTPAHRNLLDADTRFQRLVRVAIRVIRRVVQMLLERHEEVHLIMAEGNHDPASSIWLREWLATFYEDEPRVTVDTSADPYYCVEHGKTALFYHHGHKRRPSDIDTVFVAKFREVFGRTKYAYAHMGHMHHVDMKETNLMVIEQHQTLAAKDAYASRGGWMSDRSAQVITYSKRFGEVGRVRISAALFTDRT